ncbi:integrase/recombinase xerD homolog [Ptychodera flava]|uniref:integrase/recombinase xerD homolog n=1 Tax=Ptychodera flava TaxID=63121 RepID=UPI00396A09BF
MSIPPATQQLTELATAYIHNSVAGNTRRTYQVGQKCYMDFCSSHGLATLPVTIRTAILFVTNLANRGLAYRTIKVYLAGVMHHHVERGYADDVTTHALLQRTLQGIRRSIGEVRQPRLPITIDLLRRLKECLRQRADMCSNDKLMVWASFTLAFYGFLRVSEFTAQSPTEFDVNATLLARDIVLTDVIEIRIKSSKTDPYARGHTIRIAPTGTSVCAVRSYWKYTGNRGYMCPEEPAFQFADGTWLTRQRLNLCLRELLTQAGISDAKMYATHSFRSGAATTAAEAGLPDWLIKTLGRWRSDAYQIYIKTPRETLDVVPKALATRQQFDIGLSSRWTMPTL